MAGFFYDSTGINLNSSYALLPDGWYPFKIINAEALVSKKGYPMVLIKCKCMDPRYTDSGLIWHYVPFIPKGQKGDGMNVHFRKSIGVPFEGSVRIETDTWITRSFMGKVETEEYEGKKKNKISLVSPIKDTPGVEEEDSPFK